jgi:cysteine desulfuration protein SufE
MVPSNRSPPPTGSPLGWDASAERHRRSQHKAGGRHIHRVISGSPTLTPSVKLPTIETIREDFAFLDDWEDRYRYVIELGRSLEPLPEAAHNDANKVRGCVSQVWIERESRANADGRTLLHFRGDSDSHLVRGLVAITLALYSDRAASEILATDALSTFRELGLEQHLTPQRSNGVRAMVERIRSDARASE